MLCDDEGDGGGGDSGGDVCYLQAEGKGGDKGDVDGISGGGGWCGRVIDICKQLRLHKISTSTNFSKYLLLRSGVEVWRTSSCGVTKVFIQNSSIGLPVRECRGLLPQGECSNAKRRGRCNSSSARNFFPSFLPADSY